MTQLLDALPKLPYSEGHHNLQLSRLEGAGKWILDTAKFLQWRDAMSSDGTLWCNGAPGVGKTFIAYAYELPVNAVDSLQVGDNRSLARIHGVEGSISSVLLLRLQTALRANASKIHPDSTTSVAINLFESTTGSTGVV
jgi:hypothetical protein